MISPQMEEYLEAIGRLEERGDAVTTSALAAECHVAAPTATEMLRRLADLGMVSHQPRHAATLTEAGRKVASRMLRRHRLWERFLSDVLGLRWDKLHDQACELEHSTSPELEQWLAQAAEQSHTCPHGHTIPGEHAEVVQGALVALAELQPLQTARVVSVLKEEGALLRRLGALGIRPGVLVRAEEPDEQAGALALTVGGKRTRVPRKEACQVMVRLLSLGDAQLARDAGIPLGNLASAETGIIKGFSGGRGIMGRCLALGFTPGTEVRMAQNSGQGPIIVLVRDTRVALGRGEADRITVLRKADTDGPIP